MSIFNKLKSLFIVEEDDAESRQAKTKDVEVPINKTNKTTQKSKISKKDSDKFISILFKAIENANLQGFDYLEFIQSINNLKKEDLTKDENKLFLTAFTLAKTMNVSKNDLIQSANHYLKVLEKEKSNFTESLNNNANVKLQEKTDTLAKIKKTHLADKAKMEKLKLKIIENEKKINSLNTELQSADSKVKNLKTGFEDALQNIASKIESDIVKIEKYIN